MEYSWDGPRCLVEARFTFDSDLDRVFRQGERNPQQNMHSCYRPGDRFLRVPDAMVRALRLEAQRADGAWEVVAQVADTHQRLVRLPLQVETRAIRFIPEATWGAAQAHVFAWDVR